MFDGKAFGEEMVGIVKAYVDRQIAPILAENAGLKAQIAEIAARPMPEAPAALAPDMVAVRAMVLEEVATSVAALPPPEPGKSIKVEDVAPLIAEEVQKAVAALPPVEAPAPLAPDMDAIGLLVTEAVDVAVKAIPTPKDGESVTVAQLEPAIAAAVAHAVGELPPVELDMDPVEALIAEKAEAAAREIIEALPKPKDGDSVTIADLAPVIAEEVQRAVAQIPTPKDGIGLSEFIIDREDHLIVTLTDGSTRNLGRVVGKDADMDALKAHAEGIIRAIPVPKDGEDAVQIDDFEAEVLDDGRTVRFALGIGETQHAYELSFPVMIYRGVFQEGKTYTVGDTVTWGGSLWHCDLETGEKPGEAGKAWKLAVKKGRDSKETAKL